MHSVHDDRILLLDYGYRGIPLCFGMVDRCGGVHRYHANSHLLWGEEQTLQGEEDYQG